MLKFLLGRSFALSTMATFTHSEAETSCDGPVAIAEQAVNPAAAHGARVSTPSGAGAPRCVWPRPSSFGDTTIEAAPSWPVYHEATLLTRTALDVQLSTDCERWGVWLHRVHRTMLAPDDLAGLCAHSYRIPGGRVHHWVWVEHPGFAGQWHASLPGRPAVEPTALAESLSHSEVSSYVRGVLDAYQLGRSEAPDWVGLSPARRERQAARGPIPVPDVTILEFEVQTPDGPRYLRFRSDVRWDDDAAPAERGETVPGRPLSFWTGPGLGWRDLQRRPALWATATQQTAPTGDAQQLPPRVEGALCALPPPVDPLDPEVRRRRADRAWHTRSWELAAADTHVGPMPIRPARRAVER